jgi:hypothetical protein
VRALIDCEVRGVAEKPAPMRMRPTAAMTTQEKTKTKRRRHAHAELATSRASVVEFSRRHHGSQSCKQSQK